MASIGRGIGHHEGGAALRLQRGGKETDPEIVCVGDGFLTGVLLLCLRLFTRDTVVIKPLLVFHATEADVIYIKGRIGEDIIESSEAAECVLVVGVGFLNFATQTV